jgi:hypothetical protein
MVFDVLEQTFTSLCCSWKPGMLPLLFWIRMSAAANLLNVEPAKDFFTFATLKPAIRANKRAARIAGA